MSGAAAQRWIRHKPEFSTVELCAYAGETLKRAGFVVGYVSMKSEASYFQFPGRHGYIRVSHHKFHKPKVGFVNRVVVALTFRGSKPRDDAANGEFIHTTLEKIDWRIHAAIGRYMLGSGEPTPSAYRGPKWSWDSDV